MDEPGQGQAFQYQDLESQNTFRLLNLRPGRGERLECSLHHFTLGSDGCPPYRAISYTWDKEAPQYKLQMPEDTVIWIRRNLASALKAMRDKENDCWLWIDAICIHQDSNDERNHQVRLMAEIYGNANLVMVWLQSAGQKIDVDRAFRFVQAAANYDNSDHSVYRYLKTQHQNHDKDWRSGRHLCSVRYWTRKWIIQELVIARTVVL